MTHFEKVKSYLLDLEYLITHEDAQEEILVISAEDRGLCNMILDCEDYLLIMEQHIFDIKDVNDASVYKSLLQINRSIIHGAFVLTEDNKVLFRDTLQLENLDLNELEASLNSLTLALGEYADELLSMASVEA